MRKTVLAKGGFVHLLVFLLLGASAAATENDASGNMPGLTILETVMCRKVVNNEPVEIQDVFPRNTRELVCFNRITGADDGEREIVHNWYFKEALVSSITLPVRTGNWRTYSLKVLPEDAAGDWRVEILTKDGRFLQKIYFLVN